MNNKSISDLTLRLSQALDQNYDVVSMDTVLSVISALEGTTITKEQLEATRLAKYINQLRRRTNCENLARRAKSLLKRWREMVGIQQQHQLSNESSVLIATSSTSACPVTSTITSSTATASFNMPVTDNAVSTTHIANSQLSYQHFLGNQFQSNVKHQLQPYSQPTSPINLQEKSNPNEFVISVSNPASATILSKSSNSILRKKKRNEKALEDEQLNIHQQQQQPTSFANLLTGLGGYNASSSFSSTRKSFREKGDNIETTMRPVETYVIEHSSNSNSDIICLPSNTTLSSNITLVTNVPPIVIDLQDTNSSLTSLVSKDVTSTSFSVAKQSSKKSKREKKRKERDLVSRQAQPLQDCDDNNASYHHKRPPEMLVVDEKSHSACPTISNISEILSLSNSSMSSVFPSADGISRNIYGQGQSELSVSSGKMKKSDLTFAGKFKQITSSSSTGCDILNYNNDSMNINILGGNSPNQNKFSLFGGSGTTNSNDSASNSRTSQFNTSISAIKHEVSNNSKQNEEDAHIKHDINEKSMSNLSNKGNSPADNVVTTAPISSITTTGQQSIDLTTIDLSSEQNIKQPKKRGRKKGSKGVDSVIAKEISLSSQMLISSLSAAGKKVKTTKELYAEMENRKLRNVKSAVIGIETPSNSLTTWTSQQLKTISSPRTSNCSDIAESDSGTMTSEPSRDSSGIPLKTVGKREIPLDSNSNYSQQGSEIKMTDIYGEGTTSTTIATNSSFLAVTLKLKHELQEILKNLPPPPSIEEIGCNSLNNIPPCTCVVEEVGVADEPYISEGCGKHNVDSNNCASNNVLNYDTKELQTEQTTNITNEKFLSERQKDSVDQPPPPNKPKKSIFDLDFDDDEDPLHLIIADIVGKSTKENDVELTEKYETTSPNAENKLILSHKDEYIVDTNNFERKHSADIDVPPPSSANIVVIPSYKVKCDPECEARNRFEVQTQRITKFHVDTLHNCFIPNVNGNWNDANLFTNNSSIANKSENNNDLEDKICDSYNVVPFYGSEINEKIVKNLSHVKFTTKFKHKSWSSQNEILFHIPFMGVSRLPEISKVKFSKTECLNEEEKENFDNKLSNLKSDDSESALKSCSENESIVAKDIKVPIKIKKRIRKFTSLTKCAKRLKLSVNGLNAQNQCEFESSGCIKMQDNNEISPENLEDSTGESDTETEVRSVHEGNFVESRLDNHEYENMEYNDYHHEVVSHDLSDNSNDQHHVVLTIKKTTSKTNSPLNTLSNLSPAYSDMYEGLNSVANKNESNTISQEKQNQDVKVNSLKNKGDIDGFLSNDDNFFAKLKQVGTHKPSASYANFKLHKSLFFHEEIRPLVKHGMQLFREGIFHISSCSSSCSSDEEIITFPSLLLHRRERSTSSSSSNSATERNADHKSDGFTLNLQHDFICSEFKKRTINTSTDNTNSFPRSLEIEFDFQQLGTNNDIILNNDDDLPAENNLMLVSFNHIYSTRDGNSTYLNNEQLNKQSNERENNLLKQQHQNCDDRNLNNNFNLIKYIEHNNSVSSNIINNNSSIINYLDSNITLRGNCKKPRNQDDDDNKNIKYLEYQSGIRAVDEDVNDELGNNCTRLQEFKEWHEVLQLRSYNDEHLTVLPYVVFD